MHSIIMSSLPGSVGNQCELNQEVLKDRVSILKKYVDGNQEREKNALYSLQHLMHRLEHPNSE